MSSSLLKHPCRRVFSGVGCATFFFFSTIAIAETASSLSWLDSALEDTLFELRGYTDAYHQQQSSDLYKNQYASGLNLRAQSYYSLSDNWSVNSVFRMQSEYPDYRSGVFPSPNSSETKSPYVDFQVLNVLWEGEENAFLAGKEVLKLGFSRLYSPVDRFHTLDRSAPAHNEPNGDFQFSFFHYLEEDTIQLTVFPYGQQDFRQAGSRGQNQDLTLQEDDTPSGLIIYDAVRRGFDFYVGAHYGAGAYPIIQVLDGTRTAIVPESASILGGVIATHNAWTIFADGLFQHSLDREDENFARLSIGASYASDIGALLNIEGVTPTLTYSFDEVTKTARGATLSTSRDQRVNANNLLSAFRFEINSDLTITLADNYSFDSKKHQFGVGGGYSVTDSITLALTNTFTSDSTPENSSGGYTSLSVSFRF